MEQQDGPDFTHDEMMIQAFMWLTSSLRVAKLPPSPTFFLFDRSSIDTSSFMFLYAPPRDGTDARV